MRPAALRTVALATLALIAGCADILRDRKVADRSTPSGKAADTAGLAPTPRINAMTHVAAGQMLERRGDFVAAVDQYEKAVATNPKLSVGYNRLGIVHQKLGRYADADQMFRQGLKVDPRSAALHNNLGYNHLIQKHFDDAEDEFRAALTLSTDFKRARMNLAITLAQAGRLEESVVEFTRVVPADVAHYNVAALCLQKGDYAKCESALRQALAINPNCPGAKDQLDRVARMTKTDSPIKPPTPPPNSPLAGDAGREPTTP